MAEITVQRAALAGTAITMGAAASGDTVNAGPGIGLLFTNGDATSTNVTIAVPGNTRAGQAEPDVVVAVAAGATKLIGPLLAYLEDPTDSQVHLSYSKTTSLTRAAIQL